VVLFSLIALTLFPAELSPSPLPSCFVTESGVQFTAILKSTVKQFLYGGSVGEAKKQGGEDSQS